MIRLCKCPNCGAPVTYEPEKKQIYCSSCSTEFSFEQYKDMVMQAENEHSCPVCGADYDEKGLPLASRICSYCGAPALIGSNLSGAKAPGRMVPFTISKKNAMEIFRKRIKTCRFSPSNLHRASTLEKVQGIYVPYWFFDYDTDFAIMFHGTKQREERKGDTIYTHTDHYEIYRRLEESFVNLPVDGMIEMEDNLMETLEPYDQLVLDNFEEGALLGFESNVYTEDSQSCQKKAELRMENYLTSDARQTVKGYLTANVVSRSMQPTCKKVELGFCPIWKLEYRFQNKNYDMYINGQTGKFVGEIPISHGKIAGVWGALFVTCLLITSILFL